MAEGQCFSSKNLETVSLRFLRLTPQKTYQQYLLNMVAELEKLQMIDEGFRNRIIDRDKNNQPFLVEELPSPIQLTRVMQRLF